MKQMVRSIIFLLLVILAGCNNTTLDHSSMDHSKMDHSEHKASEKNTEESVEGQVVVNLEAKQNHWMFNKEMMEDIFTFNGSLPGEEIRVNEGDNVVIKLKNSLNVPTALHLHGIPVTNNMDGVPGVTQNAIMPGESYNYEFVADTPGTYWYHSHQDGANQVEMGLYGALIIEPKDRVDVDLDKVIIIDDWSMMGMEDMDHGNMGHGSGHEEKQEDSMDEMDHGSHGNMENESVSHNEMMKMMYDTLLINGKTTPAIDAIKVTEGDTVKLRFINSGLFTQVVNIPNHSFKVTHYDGQPVNEPDLLSNTKIRIAPAERYDVEIKMDKPGAWGIEVYAEENEKISGLIPIVYTGFEGEKELQVNHSVEDFLDITTYGSPLDVNLGEFTKEYRMILDSSDGGETFTINEKQMIGKEGHEVFEVVEGDVVKVTIDNNSNVDHPMHLHGHFFYVLSRNGEKVKGSPVLKDTLNVRPNETYEIAFVADNSGNWMFHCHELHHASGGMVSEVKYANYSPDFEVDPNIPNQPE